MNETCLTSPELGSFSSITDTLPGRAPTTSHLRFKSAWRTGLVFLLLLGATWLLQYFGPTWHNEINVESDDPAHYVTALLVHDYLRDGFPTTPLRFAEVYYAHYPKVAIGHWPPFFYIVQAGWMMIFGDSIRSDLVLMMCLSALFAVTLYFVARREFHSEKVAIGAALLLLCIPALQLYGGTVLADLPIALLAFWSALCWADYLDRGRIRSAVAFSIFAALAILTKGNGYAVVLLPPLTILFGRRFNLLRNARLWLAGLPIALAALWAVFTSGFVTSTFAYHAGAAFFEKAVRVNVANLISATGIAICVFALIGIVAVIRGLGARKTSGLWLSMLALLTATLLFHSIIPAGLEVRYLLTAFPSMILFSLRGVIEVATWLSFLSLRLSRRVELLGALVVVVFLLTTFSIPPKRPGGFAEAAAFLINRPELAKSIILVSSQNDGEGSFIARLAERDHPRPNRVVLRASRALADSSWTGQNYRLLMDSPAEVERYLCSVPVGAIVLDRTGFRVPNLHQPLLEQAIAAHPETWKLVGVFPTNPAERRGGGIEIYRMAGDSQPRHPIVIQAGGTIQRRITINAEYPW